jgi:hypothetical protein
LIFLLPSSRRPASNTSTISGPGNRGAGEAGPRSGWQGKPHRFKVALSGPMGCWASATCGAVGLGLITSPHGYVRQRPSFSVPRLGRGLHRPAAAALRSGAGDLGLQAGPLFRGCGGRAFARVDGEGEGSKFPRAAARPVGY